MYWIRKPGAKISLINLIVLGDEIRVYWLLIAYWRCVFSERIRIH